MKKTKPKVRIRTTRLTDEVDHRMQLYASMRTAQESRNISLSTAIAELVEQALTNKV